jgi:hypothetical protein
MVKQIWSLATTRKLEFKVKIGKWVEQKGLHTLVLPYKTKMQQQILVISHIPTKTKAPFSPQELK